MYEQDQVFQTLQTLHCACSQNLIPLVSNFFKQLVPALVILQFMMGNLHLAAKCLILRESKKFKVGIPLCCVTGGQYQSGQLVVNGAIHYSSNTSGILQNLLAMSSGT